MNIIIACHEAECSSIECRTASRSKYPSQNRTMSRFLHSVWQTRRKRHNVMLETRQINASFVIRYTWIFDGWVLSAGSRASPVVQHLRNSSAPTFNIDTTSMIHNCIHTLAPLHLCAVSRTSSREIHKTTQLVLCTPFGSTQKRSISG